MFFESKDTDFFLSLAYDDVEVARVSSRHNLESYIFNFRNILRKLEGTVNETIYWLDDSQEASKEEYEKKKAEFETIADSEYVCFHSVLSFLLTLSYIDSLLL